MCDGFSTTVVLIDVPPDLALPDQGPHRLRHRGRVPVGGREPRGGCTSLLMPRQSYRRARASHGEMCALAASTPHPRRRGRSREAWSCVRLDLAVGDLHRVPLTRAGGGGRDRDVCALVPAADRRPEDPASVLVPEHLDAGSVLLDSSRKSTVGNLLARLPAGVGAPPEPPVLRALTTGNTRFWAGKSRGD